MSCGYVYLIGAGPGDKNLITVKGLEALKKADVIIYDSLVPVSLLNEARCDAELIYAGKRAGSHYMKQDEINALLICKALEENKIVARLKGGDPFIFGRGGEEALALLHKDIPFEVIPGVSSSYAVAAYQGIPVTHRGLASSFHVITGHEDADKKTSVVDYATLARQEGTLIFLMGLSNLSVIATQLIVHGKNPKTPAIVMQEGTTARQRCVMSTLENIAEAVQREHIKAPAIILIGEVAQLHQSIAWYGGKLLSGKRILITASKVVASQLSKRIEALGGEPVVMSLIETKAFQMQKFDESLKKLSEYTWIVLTSRNGVRLFFDRLKQNHIDMRSLAHLKFAVIGQGTKEALEDRGIYADCIPEDFCSQGLVQKLISLLDKHDKVLLARAKEASDILPLTLARAGIDYTAIALYETMPDMRKKQALNQTIDQIDYVILCSASAVRAYAKMIEDKHVPGAKLICIGPVTQKAAEAAGLEVYKTAVTYDAEGVIQCVTEDVIDFDKVIK